MEFKVPYPPRCNDGVLHNVGNTYNDFKQVEERYEVLKKICPPEDVAEILRETVNHLNAAVYEKMAERLNVRPSNSQAPSVGGSSIYSFNPRPTIPSSAFSDYGRPTQESTRRRTNSTAASKNYGLTNTLVPNRHTVLSTDPFSAANEIIYEVEPSKTHPNKQIHSKNPTFTFGFSEKQPVDGLSIPITMKKPNPPVSQPKRPTKKTTELAVIPSDDESDISIFGVARRVSGKEAAKTEKPSTRAHNLSVSLKRIPVKENESAARKRKVSSNEDIPSKKKSPAEVETRPSPDTTTSNVATGKPPQPGNETLRRTKRNVSIRNQEKAKAQENKENKKAKPKKETKKAKAKTAPVHEDAEENEDVFDDGAFFGDVSSIIGSDSLALTIKNTTTKHSTVATDVQPLHAFSPFVNMRSTSGVSAISTPLSKSLAKNVLGKRIKKPNVAAELKNVQTRKPRKDVVTAVVAAPAPDNVSEESNGETSDFSD